MSRVALSYLEDSFTHALHNLVPFQDGPQPGVGVGRQVPHLFLASETVVIKHGVIWNEVKVFFLCRLAKDFTA